MNHREEQIKLKVLPKIFHPANSLHQDCVSSASTPELTYTKPILYNKKKAAKRDKFDKIPLTALRSVVSAALAGAVL